MGSLLSLQPLVHAGFSLADFSSLKMEVICSSETSVHIRLSSSSDPRSKLSKNAAETGAKSLPPVSAAFLLGLLFEREYGGGVVLRSLGLSANYTPSQHRTPYSSYYHVSGV
jgi:hypothetical protein